uniref:Blue copper protein n=1 Tax=Noccaea caerulescens TaxID=107243 RepID=A0A1J3HK56_NOCCA
MRVVLGLLLLACCGGLVSSADIINPDSANTFHVLSGSNPGGWVLTGSANPNPILNMTIGTTYYISIDYSNTAHPFGLNTNGATTGGPALVVGDYGLVVNGTSPCTGSATAGFVSTAAAPFCVLAFTPNATTPQLYYHCTVHQNMVGAFQLNAAAAAGNATTAAPTTGAPTTGAPTTPAPAGNGTTTPPTTAAPANSISPDATNTFHVTGAVANNAGWIFTSGGATFTNPTLNIAYGKTYTFSIEFPTSIHPFGLSTSATNTAVSDLGLKNAVNGSTCGVDTNTGGFTTTTTCSLTFTPPANTPQPLYYHCAFHSAMVGQIVVSGLPKSSGFALVPGFAALFAVIAGLFAQ